MSYIYEYDFPLIKKGNTVIFKVYSNCAASFTVSLIDKSKNTVIGTPIQKESDYAIFKEFEVQNFIYDGEGILSVKIEETQKNRNILAQVHSSVLNNSVNGDIVGSTYSICIEDESDNDFNDIYITLASWVKGV